VELVVIILLLVTLPLAESHWRHASR